MIYGTTALARSPLKTRFIAAAFVLTLAWPGTNHAAEPAAKGLPIARLKRSATVDFEREVLPVLKNNCLACHNQTKPKGGLILETPQDIRKGGDAGPAVVPKKPLESLLLTAAAHRDPELIMPPADNKVAAANLKPDELGLLQLWIEQGAAGEVRAAPPVAWQPIPSGLKSIYAAALTRDGEFAACGRANQIFVYHLPTGRLAARLDDPQLRVAARTGAGAHRDVVNSLAFSPDGTLLASGGYREVKLWRRGEPREFLKFPASTGHVFPMPNGRWLTVSTNGSVRIFDASGKATAVASLGAGVACVDLATPPEQLVIGRSNRVEFLSLTGGAARVSDNLPFSILSLAALDRSRVAVACGDSLVRIIAPATNGSALEVVQELSSPGPVNFLDAALPGTNRLVAGSADGTVRMWDLARGKVTFTVAQPAPLTALALRPDGEFFATAGPNGARLWKMNQSNAVAEIRGDGPALFRNQEAERELTFARAEVEFRKAALKLVETNQSAAVARQSKAAATNAVLAKIAGDKQGALTNALAAQRAAEQAVEELPPEIKKLVDAIAAAETESTNAAALAKSAKDKPDKAKAEQLATQAEAKAKLLEEARAQLDKLPAETKPKPKLAMEKVRSAIKTVSDAEKEFKRADRDRATSENELELATAALQKANAALEEAKRAVADARAQRTTAESGLKSSQAALSSLDRPITALTFSTDGSTLIGADGSRIRTWSATTGTPFQTIATKSTRTVASADGNVIAASGSSAAAWNIRPGWKLERVIGTGDERSPLADRVNALRFTADGSRLFSGGGEPTRGGEIKLWRVRDGSLVRDLPNVHSDSVLALDLSADGKYLASGAADRFAKVIDLSSGKVTRTFEGHTHHVLGLAWKRDGRTLVTAGADNVAKVWDATTGERRKNLDSFGKEVTAAQFLGVTDEALLSAGDGQVVLVKDKGDKVRSFAGASDYVYAAAVSADGSVAVAGGADGVLRAWNARDGKLLAEFPAR